MDPRQQFADQLLSVFRAQLVVNCVVLTLMSVTLLLVLYKLVKDAQFRHFARNYFEITRMYVELYNSERGRARHEVISQGTETREKIDLKSTEIKEEIRQRRHDDEALDKPRTEETDR